MTKLSIFYRKSMNLPNFGYILLNKKSSFVYFLDRLASSRHFEKLILTKMPTNDFTENSRNIWKNYLWGEKSNETPRYAPDFTLSHLSYIVKSMRIMWEPIWGFINDRCLSQSMFPFLEKSYIILFFIWKKFWNQKIFDWRTSNNLKFT